MYVILDKDSNKVVKKGSSEARLKKQLEKLNLSDKDKVYEIIKADLKLLRKAKNISRVQLSEETGVALRMISYYEQNLKDINKAQGITLYKIAKALDCSVEDLLRLTDDETQDHVGNDEKGE